MLDTCCYILSLDGRDDCVVIDPGAEAERVLRETDGRKVAAVLLTHGHFDHIGAAAEVAGDAPVYIHPLDAEMLRDAGKNGSLSLLSASVTAEVKNPRLLTGEDLTLAGMTIRVIHTPGHSRGGVTYVTEGHMFPGDTMFEHGWGRTDLYGGNQADLMQSLRILLRMRKDTPFHSGHDA